MTRRHRRVLLAIAITGIAIAALAVGMQTLFTPWLRATLERAAGRALGRELRIAGPLGASFALAPRITAFDVSLANAPWGSEPSMVRAGRVTLVLDLLSLRSRPVRVAELEIDDVHLLLEADGEGRGNWVFPPAAAEDRPPGPPVELGTVVLRGLELVYRARPAATPATVEVGELEARLDPVSRRIEVQGSGRFDELPWELAGWLGTLDDLAAARPIDHQLSGRLGDTTIEVRGRARDRLAPGQASLEAAAAGPDLAAALARFGLRSPLAGPFRVRGRFTPAGEGMHVDLEGAAGGLTAAARGSVDARPPFDRFDLRVEASGPDAATVGTWIGVERLPPRPFELAGRLRREDGRLSLAETTLQVGATSLTVAGTLGARSILTGLDLAVQATGGDLAELSSLARLRLPSGPFEITGRLRREGDGLALDGAELRSGGTLVRATGTLGEPPRLLGLDLTIELSGPDPGGLAEVAGRALPAGPFALRGRIARDGAALALDAVEGRFGGDEVSASGRLIPRQGLAGSELQLHATGPDLARLASFAGLDGVPAEPYDASGRLRVAPDGYELAAVEGTVGRLAVVLEGRLGAPSVRDGTSLSGRIQGPALAELAAWGLPATLPAEPFALAGRIRFEDGIAHLDDLVATAGGDRGRIDGVLGALPELSGLDAVIELAGPSLAELGRFFPAAGLAAPRQPSAEAYAISGRVRRLPAGYELLAGRAEVGGTTGRIDGTFASGASGRGFDLRFDVAGPDASLLSRLTGTAQAGGALTAHGRLARTDTDLLCDEVMVTVGESSGTVSGTLGMGADRAGTDLRIDLSGPDLAATLGPATGLATLPAEAFALSLEVAGRAGSIVSRRFSARAGDSDLAGSLALRLDGRPALEADLRSRHLDLSAWLAAPATEPAETGERQPASPQERLLSDEPFELGALRRLDATLRLEAEQLELPHLALRDVVLAGELRNGELRVDRLEGTGAAGGHLEASLALEPRGDGYRMRAAGRLAGGRFGFAMKEAAPEDRPSLDLEFDLRGEGRSLHELAASGAGQTLVVAGPGRIPDTFGDRAHQGPLRALLEALNPLRKSLEHTELECAIAFVEIAGGKAVLDPVAGRTDELTVVGRGRVNLATEAIDLSWTLKPRKGAGISASSIANPYVKLGGTLAAPSLDLKPLSAVTSMGAAVATGGLTIVSSGLYNRITAERKVCVEGLEEARRLMEKGDGGGP